MEWGEARDAQEGTTDLGLHASKPGLGAGTFDFHTESVQCLFAPCPCLSPSRGFMPRGELIPRRSKRMWSITPASSGPCFSPGFMKPTNSQVPPASMPCSLSHSGLQPTAGGGDGLSQLPQSARLPPAGPLGLSRPRRRVGLSSSVQSGSVTHSRCSAAHWVE